MQATVQDIIDALSEHDPALPVQVEGCDCIGPAGGVEASSIHIRTYEGDSIEPSVLITRADR